MQIIRHRKHAVNMSEAERIVSAIGGGLFAVLGIGERSTRGIALAVAGGALMRRAITGHSYLYEALGVRTAPWGQGKNISVPYELGLRVDETITLDVPRAEVYRFWRKLSNLPLFMKHIESVEELSGTRSHWVVKAPAGRTVEWDAVIHNAVEGEMIAWRSLPGANVDHAGSVWFRDAADGHGTDVRIELQYNPPAGIVGAAVATLWGQEPEQHMAEDLRCLKEILEAGGIPTNGRPRRDPLPRSKEADERAVDLASEESFRPAIPPHITIEWRRWSP